MIRPWRRLPVAPTIWLPCRSPTASPRPSPPGSSRWSPILPLLVAEFVVWLGFGALLPVMPLYFRDHGVDLATLGLVVAAWPAARLVGEPIFGWVADRTAARPADGRRRRRWPASSSSCRSSSSAPLPFILLRGARRALDRDVRPGRPRLHHRRDAARATRRGVRAVRRGADGRAAVRPGDRRRSARRSFGGIGVRLRVRRRQLDRGGRVSIGLRVRETGPEPRPVAAADLLRRRPSSRRRPALVAADGRAGRASTPTRAAAPPRTGCCSPRSSSTSAANFAAGTYDVIWSLYPRAASAPARADRAHVRDVRAADPRSCRRTSAGASTAARSSGSSCSAAWRRRSPASLYTRHAEPGAGRSR